MGWLELRAWLRVLQRQRRGAEPDPDSWDGADAPGGNFDELAKKREAMRGR